MERGVSKSLSSDSEFTESSSPVALSPGSPSIRSRSFSFATSRSRRSSSIGSGSGDLSPLDSPVRRGSAIGRQSFRRPGDDVLLQLLRSNVIAERLNLANQNIVDEEFLFVTDFASAHRPGITSLHLDNNDIACPEIEKASFPSTLERLKLDGNRRLTPGAAVDILLRLAYECPRICAVYMRDTGFKSREIAEGPTFNHFMYCYLAILIPTPELQRRGCPRVPVEIMEAPEQINNEYTARYDGGHEYLGNYMAFITHMRSEECVAEIRKFHLLHERDHAFILDCSDLRKSSRCFEVLQKFVGSGNFSTLDISYCGMAASESLLLGTVLSKLLFLSKLVLNGNPLQWQGIQNVVSSLQSRVILKDLEICNTECRILPLCVLNLMHSLSRFCCSDNPFIFIPPNVAASPIHEVLHFLQSDCICPAELSVALDRKSNEKGSLVEDWIVGSLALLEWQLNWSNTLSAGASAIWLTVVFSTNSDNFCVQVEAMLDRCMQHVPVLARCKDPHSDREAQTSAGKLCKAAILKRLLFYSRYRIKSGPAEHESPTCLVVFARQVDVENVTSDDSAASKVALKFMRFKHQYLREIEIRSELSKSSLSSDDHIVPVLHFCDRESDTAFAAACRADARFADYPYLLVLPAADRCLRDIIDKEDVVLRAKIDFSSVKAIFTQLARCVGSFHGCKCVHGDIKPRNIVRFGEAIKLIDLDASVRLSAGAHLGVKFSTGYVPPELLRVKSDGTVEVCSIAVDDDGSFDHVNDDGDHVKIVATSVDMWSLGVVLYQLLAGKTLFHEDRMDNISQLDLVSLAQWSNETKIKKLECITDSIARNLLEHMLSRNPSMRPLTAAHVLDHPFFTGRPAGRLFGAVPKWDFFISYRVAANEREARTLYDCLTRDGLATVFFDKECLPDGENWEKEFCKGLVDSKVFVPIVSEDAIKNPSKSWQNFEALLEDQSNCDNVFLEHCLAIELKQRGYIEKIFPIFIGKKQDDNYLKIDHRLELPQNCPDKVISSVQLKVAQHLDNNSLGCPYKQRSVAAVWGEIKTSQGAEVEGASSIAFEDAVKRLRSLKQYVSPYSPPSVVPFAACDSGQGIVSDLRTELEAERALVAKLQDDVQALQLQLQLQMSNQRELMSEEPVQSVGNTTLDEENDPDMLPKRHQPTKQNSKSCSIQ